MSPTTSVILRPSQASEMSRPIRPPATPNTSLRAIHPTTATAANTATVRNISCLLAELTRGGSGNFAADVDAWLLAFFRSGHLADDRRGRPCAGQGLEELRDRFRLDGREEPAVGLGIGEHELIGGVHLLQECRPLGHGFEIRPGPRRHHALARQLADAGQEAKRASIE